MASSTSRLLVLLATAVAVLVVVVMPAVSASPPSAAYPGPWSAFQNLTGCHFGDERKGLAKLKNYLSHLGYLPKLPSSSCQFNDMFDTDTRKAIRTYQRFFGLDVTGQLDGSTVTTMMAPRCGDADITNRTSTYMRNSSAPLHLHGRNLYSYFNGTPSWPPSKKNFTYVITTISGSAASINRETLSKVFATAFARWSAVTRFNFTETTSVSDADITIGFYEGDHGDGSENAFDGPGGVLAHGYAPTDGRLHLDAAEVWGTSLDPALTPSDQTVDLESVVVHEIGHLLGLGHSEVKDAIMYPALPPLTRKVDLDSDDVLGIQNLYKGN